MKVEKHWVTAFTIIAILAIIGLFWQHQSAKVSENFNDVAVINYADVAWLLTASCLVLLMTPGLSFFYGGMVGKKKCNINYAKKFYLSRSYKSALGNYRF